MGLSESERNGIIKIKLSGRGNAPKITEVHCFGLFYYFRVEMTKWAIGTKGAQTADGTERAAAKKDASEKKK